jgi:hypothetical protein
MYSAAVIPIQKNGNMCVRIVRAGLVKRWEDWPYLGEIFDLEFHKSRL